VVDVKDQPPPPEQKPPPPPPEQKFEPPPIVAPPPIVQAPTIAPPTVTTVPAPPPVIHVEAPPAPPPPPPAVVSKPVAPKGNPQSWVTSDDCPPSAQREGRQGKIENCSITQSSGSPDLDETACRLVTRRGKYAPALDQYGKPMRVTQSLRFRWQLPQE
jgi:protein TonB